MADYVTKEKKMSLFTEWSKKFGVPVWVFFVASGAIGAVLVKVFLL